MTNTLKPYRPALLVRADGGLEQSFTANVVHLDDRLVAFGEVLPDDDRGLPYGTPVHSLVVHFDGDRPEMLEFNDQGNTVGVAAVERVELARDHVRIVFHRSVGPIAGRVGLSEEIEVFEDRFEAVQLESVCVRFDEARFEALRDKLGGFRTKLQGVARVERA